MIEFVAASLGSIQDLLVKAAVLVLVAEAAVLVSVAVAAVVVSVTDSYNNRVHSADLNYGGLFSD